VLPEPCEPPQVVAPEASWELSQVVPLSQVAPAETETCELAVEAKQSKEEHPHHQAKSQSPKEQG